MQVYYTELGQRVEILYEGVFFFHEISNCIYEAVKTDCLQWKHRSIEK